MKRENTAKARAATLASAKKQNVTQIKNTSHKRGKQPYFSRVTTPDGITHTFPHLKHEVRRSYGQIDNTHFYMSLAKKASTGCTQSLEALKFSDALAAAENSDVFTPLTKVTTKARREMMRARYRRKNDAMTKAIPLDDSNIGGGH